jgi:predicted DNA-binding antitoxin AbrB/MazE fold protein
MARIVKAVYEGGGVLKLLEDPGLAEHQSVTIEIREPQEAAAKQGRRTFGSAKGLISIADDFDEPLEDFREYT